MAGFEVSLNGRFWVSPEAKESTCKTIFDCTVPYGLKERFRRPEFLAVDLAKYGDFTDY